MQDRVASGSLTRHEAVVELFERRIDIVRIEHHRADEAPILGDLIDGEIRDLADLDRRLQDAPLVALQRERGAARRKGLGPHRNPFRVKYVAYSGEEVVEPSFEIVDR